MADSHHTTDAGDDPNARDEQLRVLAALHNDIDDTIDDDFDAGAMPLEGLDDDQVRLVA